MSVGAVFYDVLPDLAGFGAKVEAGLGSANFKPIKVKVEADTAGVQRATAAASRAQAQQLAIATRGEQQLRAIRARGEQQRALLSQRTAAQQAAAQARASAAAERGSAREVAAATRNAAREAAAVERAVARETAARERAAAAAVRASARQSAAAERASVREAAAAERAAARSARARQAATSGVGSGLLKGGALTAAAIGLAAVQSAKFEKAVSNTASTSQEAAASIGVLRGEAIKYGASTAFSATEAANAQANLIKANVSVTDTVNGGLKGALDLAAAGSLEVADAAEIMATAMSQFNIPGTQASHVADLLAAAAGKAQGEVSDFAGALKYAGPVAKASGVSIEETTGALAEFANQGILGEQAGTSLRSMLVSLTAPMGAGAKEMKRYGINVRDSKGNFIGLAGAAGELQSKLAPLPKAERDAALARIFGKNSLTAATVLYENGAEGIAKWTAAVNDSGFAQRVAATKMDNLAGDVEKLGGAFQSAFIGAASSSTGPLRTVTQSLTGLVDAYNDSSDTFKSSTFIGAGLAASAAIGIGGVVKLGGALREARAGAQALGLSLKGIGVAGLGIGAGIAVAAGIVAHFAVQQAEAKARTDDLTQSLLASKGAIDGNIASTRAKSLEDSGALKAAQGLGLSIEDVTQASLGNEAAQERVNRKLATYSEVSGGLSKDLDRTTYGQNGVAKSARLVQDAIGGGNEELKNAVAAYERQNSAAQAAASSTAGLGAAAGGAVADLAAAATAAQDVGTKSALSASDVKVLTDALFGESDAATAALDATIAYNNAVSGAGKIKGGGLSTKSDKGQANIALLEREAKAIKDRAKSMIDSGKSEKDVLKVYEDGRKKLIEHAEASGADAALVKKRTNTLLETPKEVKTAYNLTVEANQKAKLTELETALGKLPPEVTTRVQAYIDAGNYRGAQALLESLTAQREAGINIVTNGADVAAGNIGEAARDRRSVINVATEGTASARGDIGEAARDRRAKINVSDVGTPGAKKDIDGAAKGRKANIAVTTSGIGSANSAINNASRDRSSTITVRTRGDAEGGTVPGRLAGGTVPGRGRPKADDVQGIDRRTGQLSVMVSSREEIINVAQADRNRAILKRINAGGTWDIIPKRAKGGTVERVRATKGSPTPTSTTSSRPSQLVAYLDLGPELGGLRRIVADIVDEQGEYAATLDRMGRH